MSYNGFFLVGRGIPGCTAHRTTTAKSLAGRSNGGRTLGVRGKTLYEHTHTFRKLVVIIH